MSVMIRALLASTFVLSPTGAFAALTTTIDFNGGAGLSDTRSIESFNTPQVSFASNLVASNLVLPELSFSGLVFGGRGDDFLFLNFGNDNPVSEVTLNTVRITDLSSAGDLKAEGTVFGTGNTTFTEPQFFEYTIGANDQSLTFTAGDFPFTSIAFNLTSPEFFFRDPDSGEIVGASHISSGIDSVSYTLANVSTPPVPEPETYAMMLAGLSLLGLISRRRKQNL